MGLKVGFFTEGGFEGKITLDNINIRTGLDVLNRCSHHNFSRLPNLSDNLYDIGVMILPKKRRMLLNYPLLNNIVESVGKLLLSKKVITIIGLDSPIDEQIWYFNFITEMDIIFCHNDVDLDYYYGLTNVRTEFGQLS